MKKKIYLATLILTLGMVGCGQAEPVQEDATISSEAPVESPTENVESSVENTDAVNPDVNGTFSLEGLEVVESEDNNTRSLVTYEKEIDGVNVKFRYSIGIDFQTEDTYMATFWIMPENESDVHYNIGLIDLESGIELTGDNITTDVTQDGVDYMVEYNKSSSFSRSHENGGRVIDISIELPKGYDNVAMFCGVYEESPNYDGTVQSYVNYKSFVYWKLTDYLKAVD